MAAAMAGDDPLAGLSPVDALRLRQELAAKEHVSPEVAAANRWKTGEAVLGLIPGPGNVLAARDAAEGGYEAAQAFGVGDWRRGAMASALAGLSAAGAVTGVPFGRMARGAAADAGRTLQGGLPATPWVGWRHDDTADDLAAQMAVRRKEQPFDQAPYWRQMQEAEVAARADPEAIAAETARRQMERRAAQRYQDMLDPNRRVTTTYGWNKKYGLPEE